MPPWCLLPPALAGVLRPELPGLAAEIIAALGEGVPDYARPLEGSFGRGVRAGVEEALGRFVDEIDASEPQPHHDAYVNLGRGEVRAGRSLEALLAAYRLGARVAWRRLVDAGRRAGLEPEVLYLLAESLFAYIDELSAESAEGYALEQSAAAGAAQLHRRRLVALLVSQPAPDPLALEAAAEAAGWRLPPRLVALAIPMPQADRAAAALPGYVLTAPVGDLLCGVVPDPEAPGRQAEIERALAATGPVARGPAVGWAEAAVSFVAAIRALRLAEEGSLPAAPLVDATEHAVALLLDADRRLAAELAHTRLAPLEDETPASRGRLTETLAAWLEEQGRITAVAERLHLHPQSVRYRLGRLRELFGESLDDPGARLELSLALRAQTLLPEATAPAVPSPP